MKKTNKKARILVDSGPRHEFEIEGVRLRASLARWQPILTTQRPIDGSQTWIGLPLLHRDDRLVKADTHERTLARKGQCVVGDVA